MSFFGEFDHEVVKLRNDFSTRVMRTQEPDDELGGMLFLALPTTVVHHIDPWSPLVPDFDDLTNGGTASVSEVSQDQQDR